MSEDSVKDHRDFAVYVTSGYSMWPYLKPREKVVARKTRAGDLKTGDLIVYKQDDKIICHRLAKKVLRKEGYLLYTRGDNLFPLSFSAVKEEALLGQVIAIVRHNKIITCAGQRQRITNKLFLFYAPAFTAAKRAFRSTSKECYELCRSILTPKKN